LRAFVNVEKVTLSWITVVSVPGSMAGGMVVVSTAVFPSISISISISIFISISISIFFSMGGVSASRRMKCSRRCWRGWR
jgi:hypothetical protein